MWFLLGVLGALAAGAVIVYVIRLTLQWLKDRLREKKIKDNAKKFLVITINKLIRDSKNTVSLDDLEQLAQLEREGKTHIIAGVNGEDIVGDLDIIEADGQDESIKHLIDRGDGRLVVEG